MTPEQLKAWVRWTEAAASLAAERALGRNTDSEYFAEHDAKRELEAAFGLDKYALSN